MLRARSSNRWLTTSGLQGAGLTANGGTGSPGAAETFIAENFGWGCTTLRSSVTGLYVGPNNQGLVGIGSTDAYGWFPFFCFNFVPLTGGDVAIQSYNGTYVTADPYGDVLWIGPGSVGTWERFGLTELSNGIVRAAAVAAQAAVAVVVVGNNTTINGKENQDRPDIVLPPDQEQLIQAVYQANPRTVVVLVASYPVAINWANENVPAILYTSHGGQELGNFLADVLFGDYNPAGRLTMTWFKSAADLPPIEDFDIRHGRTYWYFAGEPLYHFGYGLSYTNVDYRNLAITPGAAGLQDTLQVSVDVQNTGARAGDEVIQLYIHALGSKVRRPVQELKRFARVALQPGESRTVRFALPVSDLNFWDVRRSRFTVEQGSVEIQVGGSSRDIRLHGEVQIGGEVLAPRNGLEVIRAENYDDYSGVLLAQATHTSDGAQVLSSVDDGDWVAYHEVGFGAGTSRMEASVSSVGAGGTIEVHLDGLDGPVAGSCAVPSTGDWYTWTTIPCPNIQATGVHDLFLRFRGAGGPLFNLHWFRFAAENGGAPSVDEGGDVDAASHTSPLVRGSWAIAHGANLAPGGTRVQVNGMDASTCFASPTDVYFQVPDNVSLGAGVLQVLTAAGASRPVPVAIDEVHPAFFFQTLDGRNWVVAQHADFSPVVTARPDEPIALWGSGFGQTWPLAIPAPLADPGGLRVVIGGQPAAIQYAGMTIAGAYRIDVVVPNLPDGDYPVTATIKGRSTTVTTLLPIRR